jgi:CheY-like chemotaxis protein/HPt (histidine-containing phosphotransfer) domain-containing protein
MNGDIGFESKPGDGTLFWFNIKSKKRSDNFWTTAITNERIPNFDGISILVVDDNENTRFILKEYLVKWGFRIQIECSAQSAVEAILNADENKNHYDIVLIDSMLPDILLFIKNKQVKTIRMSGQTKIILMKYFGIKGLDDVTDNEYVEYDGFISKPVRSTALFECLQTVMHVEPNCLDLLHIDRKILHTMKVLVVEDNKINQKVAKVIFSKLGITCIIAEDGLKALDLMNIEQFDAIFMDCRLPFMDGFEVSRLIRNLGENNNASVPIFLMTSDSEDDVIEKCQQFGINGYISKPVTPQSILTAIEKWTHKPGANLFIDNVVLPFPSKEIETKMAQKTILDTAKLYEKVGKDEDLIVLLFTTFITDCEKYMKEIRQSINESNIEKVKFNAHTIKGSSLNLCAEDFSEAIIRLDYAAKCNDLEKSALIMAECESRWIELKAYMEKQLSTF